MAVKGVPGIEMTNEEIARSAVGTPVDEDTLEKFNDIVSDLELARDDKAARGLGRSLDENEIGLILFGSDDDDDDTFGFVEVPAHAVPRRPELIVPLYYAMLPDDATPKELARLLAERSERLDAAIIKLAEILGHAPDEDEANLIVSKGLQWFQKPDGSFDFDHFNFRLGRDEAVQA